MPSRRFLTLARISFGWRPRAKASSPPTRSAPLRQAGGPPSARLLCPLRPPSCKAFVRNATSLARKVRWHTLFGSHLISAMDALIFTRQWTRPPKALTDRSSCADSSRQDYVNRRVTQAGRDKAICGAPFLTSSSQVFEFSLFTAIQEGLLRVPLPVEGRLDGFT